MNTKLHVVLLVGVHGNEWVGATVVARTLAKVLQEQYPFLNLIQMGSLSPWCCRRGYRFDHAWVDPNRAFLQRDAIQQDPKNLEAFWNAWCNQRPTNPEHIGKFLSHADSAITRLAPMLALPQRSHPGLPGYAGSAKTDLYYNSVLERLSSAIQARVAKGAPLILIDIHLGYGEPGRTCLFTTFSSSLSDEIALPGRGHDQACLLRALHNSLEQSGYPCTAIATETGTVSNQHTVLALFLELAHRQFRATAQNPIGLLPLVSEGWYLQVKRHINSDAQKVLYPLLQQHGLQTLDYHQIPGSRRQLTSW